MTKLPKILIADDEPEARELIKHYLEKSGEQFFMAEAANGYETAEFLAKETWNILFLDIKMPGMNGIEVLQKIKTNNSPAIIFTTAFDDYALTAFDFDATDYLLKPFDEKRFSKALQKALHYAQLLRNQDAGRYLSQLSIKTGSKTVIIDLNEIVFFQADDIYVKVHTENRVYSLNETMYGLEQKLPPSQFLRTHKSFIVNIFKVTEFHSLNNGDYELLMNNKQKVKASRTYREKLRKVFKKI